jgi:hypothetical protein
LYSNAERTSCTSAPSTQTTCEAGENLVTQTDGTTLKCVSCTPGKYQGEFFPRLLSFCLAISLIFQVLFLFFFIFFLFFFHSSFQIKHHQIWFVKTALTSVHLAAISRNVCAVLVNAWLVAVQIFHAIHVIQASIKTNQRLLISAKSAT